MHQVFTFTAKIIPGQVDDLKAYLGSLAPGQPNSGDLPLSKLKNLHFASLVIVDASAALPPYLVFENNIDGTIDAHIERLCSAAASGLHEMFSRCEAYGTGPVDVGRLRRYLRDRVLLPNAAFVGNCGRSVRRINAESGLVDDIENRVDGLLSAGPAPASQELYDAVRSAIAGDKSWALAPKGRLSGSDLLKRRLRVLALIPLGLLELFVRPAVAILIVRRVSGKKPPLLLSLALVAAPVVAIAIVLRYHETRDKPNTSPLLPQQLKRLTAAEDKVGQNHFASVSEVKAGGFRRSVLRIVLFVIGRLAAGVYVNGTLGLLDNIHFAQWVVLDDGRRLLFLTNYDGSWENYLDDFIDKAANGLTAIWSNTAGFPRARFLFWGGATNERQFKISARRTQIPAAVWYSAYPELTVTTIENNSALRDGLAKRLQGSAVDTWLQRL
jgi:hypothetical protein